MDEKSRRKRFLLLQVNDALFPIGGYSHSYGLETYIQKDLVTGTREASEFIRNRMIYGFCYNEFLSARLAWEYAAAGDLEALVRLEELLAASRIPRETRDAGTKLGSRFAKTIQGMDIPYESDIFRRYCARRKGSFMTHSVIYGVFCAAVGIRREDAMLNYLYAQASAMVTNCVKTIPLSQTAGQHLLYECQDVFAEIINLLPTLTEEDLCQSAPGFDVRSMQHEGLYSRIYMS